MHRSKKKFIPLNVKWFTLICQMTRALLNKLGNKIVNSSENSPLVVRLWCKKRIKKKNWWKSLQWTDRCSIFCLKLLFVIRSHGKICPRLYRINEDGNFMKRSAKCRPVQSAVSKQSLRVSKSLLFFFSPSSSSSSLDSIAASIFCFFALYIYFSFSNNSNRPRCCELFKFNQLFLFPLPPLWMMPHLVFRLPLRFGPSYRTKINLIPQFRLLVHARCVNATMLVEMYILFETRDPVVLLLFKYVNHDTSPFFPPPPFPCEPHLLLNIEFYGLTWNSDLDIVTNAFNRE